RIPGAGDPPRTPLPSTLPHRDARGGTGPASLPQTVGGDRTGAGLHLLPAAPAADFGGRAEGHPRRPGPPVPPGAVVALPSPPPGVPSRRARRPPRSG